MPHIEEALAPLFAEYPDLILDGELYNHDLKDNFNAIVGAVRRANPKGADIEVAKSIQYHVYDMPSSEETFHKRHEYLHRIITMQLSPCIQRVPTAYMNSQRVLDQLNERYIEAGYEGQMIRLSDALYENKRSNSLMKRKEFITEEVPVISMHEGIGNWSGCIKQFTVQLPNGNQCSATPRGSRDQLKALLDSGKTPDWATVRFFGYTPDGMFRFPIVVDYGYGQPKIPH